MRPNHRIGRRLFSALLLATAFGAPAFAQAPYPSRPITIVVPFPPGGGADSITRVLASEMSATLGQPVVIDNRPGAGGNIGSVYVAQAKADGHTLLLGNVSPMVINPHTYAKLQVDPLKDLAPIALLSQNSMVIVVHPSVPAKTLPELLAYAKANPGKLNYASAGSGGLTHVAMELLKAQAGVNMTHIPYKGGAPAVQAIVAGQVEVMNDALVQMMPMVQAGKLRALAITGRERFEGAPDIPTAHEAGLRDYVFSGWLGMMAPAGTPAPIVAQIKAAIDKAMTSQKYIDYMKANGSVAIKPQTTEQFARLMRADNDMWAKVVRAANIVAD